MKRRILALLLSTLMLLSVFGPTLAFAEEDTPAPAWTANGTTVAEGTDGYYSVSGLEYGNSAYTTEKVKLDGLKIDMKLTDFSGQMAAGLVFSGTPGASYANSTVAMTLWYNPYANGQSRFYVGPNHDYNGGTMAYSDASFANATLGLDKTMVLNNVSNGDIRIEITSHDDSAYKVKFIIAQAHLLWGDNVNYADESEGGHSCTFYMKKADFAGLLDGEGKLYVSAVGLGNPNYSVKATEAAAEDVPPSGDDVIELPTYIGTVDTDWPASFGTPPVAKFASDGYTEISNFTGWGARAHFNHLVKLDGLELSFRASTKLKDCVGIIFGSSQGAYFGEGPLSITYWNDPYAAGQARLSFAGNHNFASPSVVYTAPDLSSPTGFSVDQTMVCVASETIGWTIKFESYNDDFYSLTITMTDGAMWEINANYNAEAKSCTVYLPKSTMAGILNENGECYIMAAGFPEAGNPAPSMQVKINDANHRAYLESDAKKVATEKLQAYVDSKGNIVDIASFDAAMAVREEAIAAAYSLRAREKAESLNMITWVDILLAQDENIALIAKKSVTDKIDAANTVYYDLKKGNSALNKETLASAHLLIDDAKAEYKNRASLLSEEAKAEIDALLAALDYDHDYCIALLWILDYTTMAYALNAEDPAIVDGLVAVKAFREAYPSTDAYVKVNTVLKEADKADFENAMANVDDHIVNIETVVLPELKDKYLSAFEEKLAADLSIKPNLDDAKAAYADIGKFVVITEEDVELYGRYVAAYAVLKEACENYVEAQIEAVRDVLDEDFTSVDEFKSVRNAFKSIKLDYLMEENADLAADLELLEAEISENVFYYLTTTSIPKTERNETGIMLESKPEFPARLNYNKPLDLKKGTEVVIELTSAAYYNDGTSANNLCFNFLADPECYKSMSDGISIIIWLYPTESSVQIMNYTDVPVATSSISTPIDGGTITISVKYEEYYSFVEDASYWAYVIRVNEAEIVLTAEALTNNGHTMSDEVYFSMGSFADNKANPNILTLVSVDGFEFGKPAEEPECTEHVDENKDGKCDVCGAEVDLPDDPTEPTEPGEGDEGEDEELSLIQKIARFFRELFDKIVAFFKGLFVIKK